MYPEYDKMTEEEVLELLLTKCADDEDAVDSINRTKEDLPYLRSRKSGQTPRQRTWELIGHLETWH